LIAAIGFFGIGDLSERAVNAEMTYPLVGCDLVANQLNQLSGHTFLNVAGTQYVQQKKENTTIVNPKHQFYSGDMFSKKNLYMTKNVTHAPNHNVLSCYCSRH
jgi:hypothetical protein